jgi:hypothetical protein
VTRYSLRYGTTRIPMVEVTIPTAINERGVYPSRVVKRIYGITLHHAYRRALVWARQNGDPR